MPSMQLRQNVRNLLVGATLAQAQKFRENAVERGAIECARYAEEFIREVEADFEGCET